MNEQEFVRLYRMIKARYGIDLSRKREIVSGRLDNYLRTSGYKDYTEYLNAVEADRSGNLEKTMVDMLTTNHTFFMREFEHFEFLKDVVLPEIKQREHITHDVRVWCGASSTGEEPYMLAMLMSDFFGMELSAWDTTLLATDISVDALSKAKAGIYHPEQVESLPESWRRRYLHHNIATGDFEVTKEIKDRVLFRRFNLMDPLPFRKPLHLVMLRNVMIYFDQKTKNELVQRIYDTLLPGGYLIIGKTETIDRGEIPFEMIQPSIFQKGKLD